MKKLRKSIRPNHQYPSGPAKPEVDLDLRSHPNMGAPRKLWKMDSLTPKTYVMKKSRKSIRPNHQYPSGPAKPEVDLDFRSHPNMGAPWNYEKWIPWPKNVCNEEITKIHKTQSSVPSRTCKTGSWPGFSKSSKNGSSMKLWKMDSLTPKTYVVKKLRKSIRPNHQYPQGPAKPEVDLEFRSHPNRLAAWNYEKWITWPRKRR